VAGIKEIVSEYVINKLYNKVSPSRQASVRAGVQRRIKWPPSMVGVVNHLGHTLIGSQWPHVLSPSSPASRSIMHCSLRPARIHRMSYRIPTANNHRSSSTNIISTNTAARPHQNNSDNRINNRSIRRINMEYRSSPQWHHWYRR